ncbi:30S ribosomal protein S17 [Candidatus Pacearchaeota archaeon]|nr:30S ribosomal protein S17 [Candidatus Pacearchaeota archaeon]
MEKATKNYGKNLASAIKNNCKDQKCPFHGSLRVRGKTIQGTVTKKFPKRVVIVFERIVYVRKYERYKKTRIKIHARLPDCISNEINIGDTAIAKECRPLSKIIHFVVVDKLNLGGVKK